MFNDSFEKAIDQKEKELISVLKKAKNSNKKYRKVSNGFGEQLLLEIDKAFNNSSLGTFPELFKAFELRFQEYESEHTQYFFSEHSEKLNTQFIEDLGYYEGLCKALENWRAIDDYLETAYVLNENLDLINLNFSPECNPVQSDLFFKMQAKRFPNYGKEIGWEANTLEGENSQENYEILNSQLVKPGSVLDKSEKLYILHLLYQFVTFGSEMTTTEFLRILHLTVDEIDTSADITGDLPNYRKVHDGFFTGYSKNKRIKFIESVISKIQRYQVPMLKQMLEDKLRALTKKN